MDIHKSSNIEGLNSFLLKECLIVAISVVTHLFNCIIRSGDYPDSWKLGTIVPLFKGGNKLLVGNYRPVSLLDFGEVDSSSNPIILGWKEIFQ